MQGQMYVPPLSKINKILISIYVGMFLLSSFSSLLFKINLIDILGLSVIGLKSGYFFQLITYPFVDSGLMGVVFNALILWFIGSELEQKWGAKFYLKFLGFSAYSCGFIYILIGLVGGKFINFLPLFGLAGVNLALLIAYGIIYSERTMIFMFIFPMKAKYFCMILAGIELFMALTASAFNSAWAHLISMLCGYLYLKYQSMKARGLGLSQVMKNHKDHQAKQNRSKLRLVKGEGEKSNPEDPKYWQ